jgi:hypothetical protein
MGGPPFEMLHPDRADSVRLYHSSSICMTAVPPATPEPWRINPLGANYVVRPASPPGGVAKLYCVFRPCGTDANMCSSS